MTGTAVPFAPLTIKGLDRALDSERRWAVYYLNRIGHYLYPDALAQAQQHARQADELADLILSRPIPRVDR